MGAVTSRDQVIREDLSEAVSLADVKNTPISSRMPKGPTLKAMEFSWNIEKMGQRRDESIPENMDVDAFEGDETKKMYNRAQKFWRTPRVSTEAEEVNETPAEASTKYNKQKAKKTKEQKRDIEWRLCSDKESREDAGVKGKGSEFKGLGRVINDGTLPFTDERMIIPSTYRTPTAQIYTGLLADLLETHVNDMMQGRWEKTGAMSEFILFCASRLKSHISANFGKYEANKEGFTAVIRTNRADIDRRKLVLKGVDVVEGDYGTYEVDLEPFMPTLQRGYGLELSQLSERAKFKGRHTQFPYLGGGKSGLIESIIGYEFGDPRSHFKIAPSDEVANDPENGGELEEA